MARARPIPGLGEDDAYAAVAAKVVATRVDEMAGHSERVLDLSDIERLHDMRVATRRLRAALEVFEPCFPRKRFRSLLEQVKALADALGERRDRDVTIVALSRFEEVAGTADAPGVRSLIAAVRAEQARANAALEPFLEPARFEALRRGLQELAAAAAAAGPTQPSAPVDAPRQGPMRPGSDGDRADAAGARARARERSAA